MIFGDALATGWEDWSWESAVNLGNGAPVQSGNSSIAVTFNTASAGFSLRAPTAIDATQYSAIRFLVYGGAKGNTLLVYTEGGDDGPLSPGQYTLTVPAGQWTTVMVPLSTLGNPSVIKRITLQENGGGAQETFYVDELMLVQ